MFEIGRVACELIGTRIVLGPAAARLPARRLVRAQLLGQMLDVLMPAGRAAAEAAKAAMFSGHVGVPQAAAAGTALQLAALFANALMALAGYAVSAQLGLPSALRVGLLSYAVAMTVVVASVGLFAASGRVRAWFERVHVLHASMERFAELLWEAPSRLTGAVLAQLASRVLQALQLALTAVALGAKSSLAQGLLTQAVYLVGAALGDLVPGQIGTTDAAFVLAAPALGLTAVAAFSVTLAVHAVQGVMAIFSGLISASLWWMDARRQTATGLLQLPLEHHKRSREFG
jgi:hypothetical protein